ncbi:MAG TPA: hypothetical protein C5S37_11090 [Methanophagales archaeon]|nr:hypothetical protein [Methanophagales archaeon]
MQPNIWVDPTSFDVPLPPDTIYSTNLTVGNGGNATLTYEITDTEGVSVAQEPVAKTESNSDVIKILTQKVEDMSSNISDLEEVLSPGEYEIAYDDGEVDYSFCWTGPGAASGVHFTSPTYHILSTIRFYIDSNLTAFDWKVLSWTGTQPGSVIASGTTTPTSSGWHDVDVGSISVPSDFVVAIYWKEAYRPTLGSDADPPIDYRSWDYDTLAWSPWNADDYMIRAVMSTEEGWLSESPTSGTIEHMTQTNITVTFNTTGLSIGDYYADINITSNDPDESLITVPVHLTVKPVARIFDTEQPKNPYPSIMGVHTGNFTPKRNITVHQIYTYPCAGTGGHSEYVAFYDYEKGEEIANASWNGYQEGDYHNIRFKTHFTLYAGVVYTYKIRTGSYPQIIHRPGYENDYGTITCDEFTDANGRVYNDWIPAIKLWTV